MPVSPTTFASELAPSTSLATTPVSLAILTAQGLTSTIWASSNSTKTLENFFVIAGVNASATCSVTFPTILPIEKLSPFHPALLI